MGMENAAKTFLQDKVKDAWVDYNGHMNDAAYVHVFSLAMDEILRQFGLDEAMRTTHHFSIYTLENHVCYLQECHAGDSIRVMAQLIDHDSKRVHLFLTMTNDTGDALATSEQMLMGVSTQLGKSAPFPDELRQKIEIQAERDATLARPDRVGSSIGIRRR